MVAVKGNRVYQIVEAEKEARRQDGFDIYEDDGTLIAYSAKKTVPYEQYAAVVKERDTLRAEKAANAQQPTEKPAAKKGR